eukprot:gene11417-biopygen3354
MKYHHPCGVAAMAVQGGGGSPQPVAAGKGGPHPVAAGKGGPQPVAAKGLGGWLAAPNAAGGRQRNWPRDWLKPAHPNSDHAKFFDEHGLAIQCRWRSVSRSHVIPSHISSWP